jgi:hypothetical protein
MNVLEEAGSLINGERQEQYGNASESHQRIADLWAGYLGTDVTEFDVVNMMILLKVSRTRNQYHRDSYVDIAGYAGLGERLHREAAGEGIPVELHVEGFTDLTVPRVWESLADVPEGLKVTGSYGVGYWYGEPGFTGADRWAPFTEVLEGTK